MTAPEDAAAGDRIALASILDLRAAAPLADAFIARRGQNVTVDASGVERVGGQCAQVLVSAAKTWTADGATLTVDAPSAAFSENLETMGLSLEVIQTGTTPA
ncbi:MAG: STAS domain-containing protein [Pseudomonadota bacterium]